MHLAHTPEMLSSSSKEEDPLNHNEAGEQVGEGGDEYPHHISVLFNYIIW